MPRFRYPWTDWEDGAQWFIYKGEDYQISTYTMQISIHKHAKSCGLKASTRSFTEREKDELGGISFREGLMLQFWNESDG